MNRPPTPRQPTGVLWAGIGAGLVLGAALGFLAGVPGLGIGVGLILGACLGWVFQLAVAERPRRR